MAASAARALWRVSFAACRELRKAEFTSAEHLNEPTVTKKKRDTSFDVSLIPS